MMCLSVTLLPVPEPPTITTDSPRATSIDMSSSTFRPPSVLSTCCREIIGFVSVIVRVSQNNSFVRKKSVSRMISDALTTAAVVARPTPSAPPLV